MGPNRTGDGPDQRSFGEQWGTSPMAGGAAGPYCRPMGTPPRSPWLLVALGALSAVALLGLGLGIGLAVPRAGDEQAAEAAQSRSRVAVTAPPATTAAPTTTSTVPTTTSTAGTATLVADFEWEPAAPRAGDKISLLDRSSGGPQRWVWTWNANVVSSNKAKGVTTSLRADTPVTLTVCGSDGACDSVTKVVTMAA